MANILAENSLQLNTRRRYRKITLLDLADGNWLEVSKMSEYEAEVKKAEKELEQGLAPVSKDVDEFLGEVKMNTDQYGQKAQEVTAKARVYAEEAFSWAGDKFKELQNNPMDVVEDAKEYARQKPGQTILISAVIGLVIGFLLRRR